MIGASCCLIVCWLLLAGLPAAFTGFDTLLPLLLASKMFNLALLVVCGILIYRCHDDLKQAWWYWVPIVALLVLHHDRKGTAYLMVSSTVGLLIYLLDVWARFDSGLPFLQRHLLGTVLLNVQIVVLLVLQLRETPASRRTTMSG